MILKEILHQLIQRQDLSDEQMQAVMQHFMTGQATPAQIAGFLIAMRMKGETVTEIAAAAKVLKQLALPLDTLTPNHYTDIVGTGGDESNLFNVSTTSAFVIAAAGARVAKHGSRSMSSRSGSADLLEAAGININLSPEQVAHCINTLGIGFLFAPSFHPAMKYTMPPRKELAIRTLFNLLGPLINPAHPSYQLLGVFAKEWLVPLAEVSHRLGVKHLMVVHSEDGLDEISIAAPTYVAEMNRDQLTEYRIDPQAFGFKASNLNELKVNDVNESLVLFEAVLNNTPGPARDMILLNAGAGIYVAGLTKNLADGITKAEEVLKSGVAKAKYEELKTLSQHLDATQQHTFQNNI